MFFSLLSNRRKTNSWTGHDKDIYIATAVVIEYCIGNEKWLQTSSIINEDQIYIR